MVDGSNARAMDRLAGLACLAVILASGAGCLVATRLLTGDPRAPLGCAADIGAFGTCAWLSILAPAPRAPSAPAAP
jgi:hypothetical protein